MNKIQSAYKSSENFYNDVLTQNKWWAKWYNHVFWRVDGNVVANKVLEFIPNNFNGKLLDVPVGTGVFTAHTYARLQQARVTCIDYSEAMLDQARETFGRLGLSHVRCLQGDVGDLQFPYNTFDIVLSMNGFHAFPDKGKAFSETARVLKKGGMFVGCFYIKNGYKPTDFVVNTVLTKKGWFTPPFQTLGELRNILNHLYTDVKLFNQKAMVYFKCIK